MIDIKNHLQASFLAMSSNVGDVSRHPAFLDERSQFRLEKGLELIDPTKGTVNDFENVLLWMFEEITSSLYSRYLQIPSPIISVCVYVQSDGFGDFGAALKTIEYIKKNFSNPTIFFFANICTFSGVRKNTIESSIPAGLSKCILAEKFNEAQEKEVQMALQKSELIVQPAWDDPADEDYDGEIQTLDLPVGNTPYLSFKEYGCDSIDLGPCTGIGETRMGIFLFDDLLQKPFSNLQFVPLREMLSPLEDSQNHAFYFSYIKQQQNLSLAFVALCCLTSKSHHTLIDVIISCDPPESEDINDGYHFLIPALVDAGIKTITFFKRNDVDALVPTLEINTVQPQGKSLRVINPFPLHVSDFDLLVRKSTSITGSTGDLSFSKSLPSLPFYQILDHKEDFYESILQYTWDRFGFNSPICKYFYSFKALHESILHSGDEETSNFLLELAELFANPELHQQFAIFYSEIKKFYHLEDSLIPRMVQKLAHKRFPEILEFQNAFLDHFPQNTSQLESHASTLAQMLEKIAKDPATPVALVEES